LLLNIIGSNLYFRLDLTKEKRYTLSEDTREILKNLDNEVFIRIYLEGDLNIQLTNFQKSIREILDEFRNYAGIHLQYELTDPFANADMSMKTKILEDLYKKGLKPVNIYHRDKDGSTNERVIIPGATISYKGIDIPLNLLLNDPSKSSEENLNNSIESLEYTFISTIKNITNKKLNKIAFLEGHGEWPEPFVSDIMQELSKSFQVDRGEITANPGILDPYECVIIAGPIEKFKEADKFVIDQYIMQGGKVVWLLDGANVNFDSLAFGYTLALPNDLNLDDMLFRYGARINPVLIRDKQCNGLMVNVALAGNKPNFQLAPWVYYPIVTPNAKHSISKDLNLVLTRFTSSIDTIQARKDIKKTILLQSSLNSGSLEIPLIIKLEEINNLPTAEELNNPKQIIGVLLEGQFESVFKNRMLDSYFDNPPKTILKKSEETKMVIIADADFIRNDVSEGKNGPTISPLGYDRATQQTYGNKDFLVNTISYLTDDSNLLELRGREFKLRLLNKAKIEEERLKWQLINILLPVLLVLLSGLLYNYMRKRYYTR
jgi:gliding-associated putative ABC transporter substrate-binding component GldG